MDNGFKIREVKYFLYKTPTGNFLELPVPDDMDQTYVGSIVSSEYLITKMTVGRDIAEVEISTLKVGNSTVGYLIPRQAILSREHPKNGDPLYAAYALIAAQKVCNDSMTNLYDLIGSEAAEAENQSALFSPGVYYCVVWLKKLKTTEDDFYKLYFASFARYGVFRDNPNEALRVTGRTLVSYDIALNIKPKISTIWPDYVRTIICELSPFAKDPFLRFFYLYQIVEVFMAADFSEKLKLVKDKLNADNEVSITKLKDYMDEFKSIVKEKTRINKVLNPACETTSLSLDALLTAVAEDLEGMSFGDKVYKIRNIIFHDYTRMLQFGNLVSELEENLMGYMLERKL
ncbi:putative DUF4145 domain-containing protein [Pseudomonas sp. IT-P12]|uniref:hypothetical protein n=1 Tax=Pseudomonas sp. IT-P12 TaxID=3026450 RepID=UPI0039E01A2F